MFIVFDGIDGAGKTTHLGLIKEWLKKRGVAFQAFKEPGGTLFANKIRRLFLHSEIDPVSQLCLLSAARANLCLKIAKIDDLVLCDRFFDSTYAYQGKFFSDDVIDSFVKLSCTVDNVFIKPDFTFLFLHSYGKGENYRDKVAMKDKDAIINRFKQRMLLDADKYCVIEDDTVELQQEAIQNKISQLLMI